MTLSNKGIKLLHQREGLRLSPYLDTKGVPTIGFGNTYYLNGKSVTMKDKKLTYEESVKLGAIIANNFAVFVDSVIKSKVNQNQFDACVSFAYNVGEKGFKTSTVLKRINANPNDPTISSAFLMWRKPADIIGRRKSEVRQYFETI